jgi:hypothetical protein
MRCINEKTKYKMGCEVEEQQEKNVEVEKKAKNLMP